MNKDKIDEAVLALLYLGHWTESRSEIARAWKALDWDAMGRLHEQGLISDPVGKAKSVTFSDEGLNQAKAAFDKLFGHDASI